MESWRCKVCGAEIGIIGRWIRWLIGCKGTGMCNK